MIKVDGLGKEYALGARMSADTLRDQIAAWLALPLERFKKGSAEARAADRLWALSEVCFQVAEGEVVGVVGRNGAGKSTLLKILSRITDPTTGRAELRGRIASLLEVGTGFHPELSGRDNIFLNGAILGMTRAEVARRFDEIVAFSGIEKFLDTPVKRYSSGMYVRLAFAVAAHLEAEILIVDEVLAVGDAEFQKRSLGKMRDVAKSGRTVLFVSHNLSAIRNMCGRGMFFESGRLRFDGQVEDALQAYERSFKGTSSNGTTISAEGPLADVLSIDEVTIFQRAQAAEAISPLHGFEIHIKGRSEFSIDDLEFSVSLFRDGLHVTSCRESEGDSILGPGGFCVVFKFAADIFFSGFYTVGIGALSSNGAWLWCADAVSLDFSEDVSGRSAYLKRGMVRVPFSVKRSHS